jgi:hypothetical protein
MTRQVEALIAGAYLAGTNTRRVRRAMGALFKGAVGKDVVSRTWRKVQGDCEAWARRDLSGEDVVRLILDGTVVRVRLDRRATSISLLVVLGVRRDGQKVLLAVRNMGGESEAAWRDVLDDLVARGLQTPQFLIIDGASGLERALAALWPDVPTQRCTVHKHLCGRLSSNKAFLLARCSWPLRVTVPSFRPSIIRSAGAHTLVEPDNCRSARQKSGAGGLTHGGDRRRISRRATPEQRFSFSRAAETNGWSGIRSVAPLCPAYLRGIRRWPSWVYARVPGTNPQRVLRGTDACPVLPGLS